MTAPPASTQSESIVRFRALVRTVGAYAAQHPVFRVDELDAALYITAPLERARRQRALLRLVRLGALTKIAKLTYAIAGDARTGRGAPPWRPTERAHVYAAAGRLHRDGVIAYRSALETYRVLPVRQSGDVVVVTAAGDGTRVKRWDSVQILRVKPPRHVRRLARSALGVGWMRAGDTTIRVTAPERTFVDAVNRPYLVGSWQEILEGLAALVGCYRFDWDALLTYTRDVKCGATASRVGWLLEQGREWNGVTDATLAGLERLRASGPQYWISSDRPPGGAGGARYASRWQIMVPRSLVALSCAINRQMRIARSRVANARVTRRDPGAQH
jgi:predicted transcriptional regulator of viral defense system